MTTAPDPLHWCKRCRFSQCIPDDYAQPVLYCRVQLRLCRYACPAYEREPGADDE